MKVIRKPGRLLPVAALAASACAGSDDPLQQPRPLYEEPPFEYPVELWDEGVEGETVLMVRVAPQGGVDSIYVDASSGHAAMDSAAVRGARTIRFEPARRGTEAVEAWVRLPVRFARDGAGDR